MVLLRTKLFVPPPRPNLVPRPKLVQRLNLGLQQGHKLTLISAPAGFGKTTLARLRALGQLTELRATDLRFSISEADEFLNQVMGLGLSADEFSSLESRTEGWIAGLQLAATSMQGLPDATGFIESFTGSHHFVLDYLVAEVLERQSINVQEFLTLTSIPDRLTGSLCDTLTGQDNGQQILEYLEQANLFIVPLDHERRWYRYHHLFTDLLRQRLRQIQSARVPILHRRASEWYELNGFPKETIEHALHAGDYDRAAYLIEVQADAVWESGELSKMYRWLERMPDEIVFAMPELSIYHAVKMFRKGTQDVAERSLQIAGQVLNTGIDATNVSSIKKLNLTPEAARKSLLGRIAAIRALMASYRGDSAEIIPHAQRALDYLPKYELAWRSTAAISIQTI